MKKQKLSRFTEAFSSRIANLPAALSIPQIAAEFSRPADTVRKQIRRGTFQLRVQVSGGEKFVALADYLRFLSDGEIQTQPAAKRPVGRPTNKARAASKGGAAC